MELRQLRYFVAIVDHGSLSRAARVLHIAQPALTQQIRQLEDEMEAQLLHRSAQGVIATDAGKVFYEHALAILKQVQDAKQAVAQSTDKPSGTVALGIPQSVSNALALPLLNAVRSTYPEITLQLTEELTGNLITQLKSGRINLAVLFDDGQLSSFAATPMIEEEMLYITRAKSQYGVSGRKGVPLARAIQAPLILPGLAHGVRPRIENLVRAQGMSLDNVIEINSVAILKSAILADIGATILPVAPLLADIERGDMVAHAIAGETISRTLVLCASRNIPLTTAAAAVERLVLDVTDQLCRSGQWGHTRVLERE
ncbi:MULTISPECIES: LysR substrate-binding domain-containing protein [unclassified Herbaspirillum]|uniref:LysR substrate-binding domain-containing protein n=1 Tax=unclassified Herbaspirillum TaxID=2624150 RepID=UPI00098184DB|nr:MULTISPECIES: LysR substrate-binding domain-containing protein [unclassified Herbaspirillum]MCI1016557.1 LysR family transcriptional regulator [Herbaspirillum sp. C7C2]ONN65651.1 LysR family transcriptional regulator [Herbaspirillum sp. VT-16-41]